jgi:hypothetical protein
MERDLFLREVYRYYFEQGGRDYLRDRLGEMNDPPHHEWLTEFRVDGQSLNKPTVPLLLSIQRMFKQSLPISLNQLIQ